MTNVTTMIRIIESHIAIKLLLSRPPGQVDNRTPPTLVWRQTLRQHDVAGCNQSCLSPCNQPRQGTVLSVSSCPNPSHRSLSESDCHGRPATHKYTHNIIQHWPYFTLPMGWVAHKRIVKRWCHYCRFDPLSTKHITNNFQQAANSVQDSTTTTTTTTTTILQPHTAPPVLAENWRTLL